MNEINLKELIISEPFRFLSQCNVDTRSGCKECDYRYLCGGACRVWDKNKEQLDVGAAPSDCSKIKKESCRFRK